MKTTLKFLAGLVALGGLLVLSSCAISGKATPAIPRADALREVRDRIRSSPEPSILFIGNSYSFGVPRELGKLTRRANRPIRHGLAAHDGWSLARHASDPATLRQIRRGGWDIIVLQEYSRNPANLVSRETMMIPGVRQLAREARAAGSVPILYQTWGRKYGDAAIPGDTFASMNQRVREGYQLASRKAGGLLIVPAGDAWERELAADPDAPIYQPDHHHPTMAGDAITARVFYETLFGEPAP